MPHGSPTHRLSRISLSVARLKIEINSRGHHTEHGHVRQRFEVRSRWWSGEADITMFSLAELLGTNLRALLIDKLKRRLVYTDFEDLMSGEIEVELPEFTAGTDFVRFRAKAHAFLRGHLDHVVIEYMP